MFKRFRKGKKESLPELEENLHKDRLELLSAKKSNLDINSPTYFDDLVEIVDDVDAWIDNLNKPYREDILSEYERIASELFQNMMEDNSLNSDSFTNITGVGRRIAQGTPLTVDIVTFVGRTDLLLMAQRTEELLKIKMDTHQLMKAYSIQ